MKSTKLVLVSRAPFSLRERAHTSVVFFERRERLFASNERTRTQLVPMPLPAVVCVGSARFEGYVCRPVATCAPRLPLFLCFQLEGVCMTQRFFERQELLVFVSNIAGAQPVPMLLPPVLRVGCLWAGGYIGRTCGGLASFTLSCPCFFRLRERACSSTSLNGRNCLFF